MIRFYATLLLVNLFCFLPLYLSNIREQPNPFSFFTEDRLSNKRKVFFFYAKPGFTDPFRINFDFTVAALLLAFTGSTGGAASVILTTLLAFGFIEILYASVMRSVFKRMPAFRNDMLLAASGLSVIGNFRYPVLVSLAILIAAVIWAAHSACAYLLEYAQSGSWSALLVAAALVPSFAYKIGSKYWLENYPARVVYSPIWNFLRGFWNARKVADVLKRDATFYVERNAFQNLELSERPDIITVCIESYGSHVYQNAEVHRAIAPAISELSDVLDRHGYNVASDHSIAPIFAGGSWLSYATMMYGTRIDDTLLYNTLFANKAFSNFESYFHILRRNAYRNIVLCPLGGVNSREVNWSSIEQCFQADEIITFDRLAYGGQRVGYLVQQHSYAAPDEYALNYTYDKCKRDFKSPFSLFFLTLNSHYPYRSPIETAGDWRSLNDSASTFCTTHDRFSSVADRYAAAISYQLRVISEFIERHCKDDFVLTIFGDHQPPFVATEADGCSTPLHVISRAEKLVQPFYDKGFSRGVDLSTKPVGGMRHEAFVSLIARGLNSAYGVAPEHEFACHPNGILLFDDL